MTKDELIDLANRISEGRATDDDIAEYIRITKNVEADKEPNLNLWMSNKKRIYTKMESRLFNKQSKAGIVWIKVAVAASIFVFLGVGTYFLVKQRNDKSENKEYAYDFSPGTEKAIIVLANGRKIIINNVKSGVLAKEGGMIITKNRKGRIIYQPDPAYRGVTDTNSIITPRGSEHQVILVDGTHVWLNAASTLKFPVAFNKFSREVKLSGEAYFEVAKDSKRPFRVVTNKQTVEVHGTHFNINAYSDEQNMTTTLLEGSVMIFSKEQHVWLKPGEECQHSKNQNSLLVRNCRNIDQVVAWKNGMFSFENAEAGEIMKQIGRWYDVEVVFKNEKSTYRLSADFSRNMNASKVLKILNYTGLKFKTEEKKIIVE